MSRSKTEHVTGMANEDNFIYRNLNFVLSTIRISTIIHTYMHTSELYKKRNVIFQSFIKKLHTFITVIIVHVSNYSHSNINFQINGISKHDFTKESKYNIFFHLHKTTSTNILGDLHDYKTL